MSNYKQVADALFADRYGQPLDDWVADQRDPAVGDGQQSWRRISQNLRDLTGGLLDVTPQTLINWMDFERETAA